MYPYLQYATTLGIIMCSLEFAWAEAVELKPGVDTRAEKTRQVRRSGAQKHLSFDHRPRNFKQVVTNGQFHPCPYRGDEGAGYHTQTRNGKSSRAAKREEATWWDEDMLTPRRGKASCKREKALKPQYEPPRAQKLAVEYQGVNLARLERELDMFGWDQMPFWIKAVRTTARGWGISEKEAADIHVKRGNLIFVGTVQRMGWRGEYTAYVYADRKR